MMAFWLRSWKVCSVQHNEDAILQMTVCPNIKVIFWTNFHLHKNSKQVKLVTEANKIKQKFTRYECTFLFGWKTFLNMELSMFSKLLEATVLEEDKHLNKNLH